MERSEIAMNPLGRKRFTQAHPQVYVVVKNVGKCHKIDGI